MTKKEPYVIYLNMETEIKKFLKKTGVKPRKFYERLCDYPIDFTYATFCKWVNGWRYPLPENAYWIHMATNCKVSLNEIIFPLKRLIKLKEKLKLYKGANH